MASIRMKGMVVGEGMPKVIVPVMAADASQATAAAREAVAAGADCVELRLDSCVAACDAAAASALCREVSAVLPDTLLLATFRSRGQGGRADLPAADYCALVMMLAETGGADMVDVEMGLGDERVAELCRAVRAAGAVPVVSHHDFQETPCEEDLRALLARMECLGAGVCKFAVMANGPSDALRVMQATEARSHEASVPLLTMAMGPHGAITRLAGGLFGSCMTFCSLGEASAPGQVPVDVALRVMRELYRAAKDDAEQK